MVKWLICWCSRPRSVCCGQVGLFLLLMVLPGSAATATTLPVVCAPEVVGIISKEDRVRMMLHAGGQVVSFTRPITDSEASAPAVIIAPVPAATGEPSAAGTTNAITTETPAQLPPPPARVSMVWQFNPDTVTMTTGAVTVLAPVWAALTLNDDSVALLRRRASRAYVEEAHRRGYRVWLTVQMLQPEVAHAILLRPELARAARLAILALTEELGADGVNLDAENHLAGDSLALTAFASDLAAELRARQLVFSVCITRRAAGVTNRYDRRGLARAADYLALMAYDEHWSSCPENGPVASLDWVEAGVAVTLDEVPPEKLLLGVPLYAYDWVLLPDTAPASDSGVPAQLVRPASFRALALDEVWNLAADSSTVTRRGDTIAVRMWLASPGWSERDGTMYMRFVATNGEVHEIWFENILSLERKLELVEKYSLAGAAAWQAYFADRAGLAWRVFQRLLSPPGHD